MEPQNYNMNNIFGPGGPQTFNPNIPNQPPSTVYPNQFQNIPPQQNYPPQSGYPPQNVIPPQQVYSPQQPPSQIPPMNPQNFVTPDPACKKCGGAGVREKHGKQKKCKCIKYKEKELERNIKKDQKKYEKEQKKEQKKLEKEKKKEQKKIEKEQ